MDTVLSKTDNQIERLRQMLQSYLLCDAITISAMLCYVIFHKQRNNRVIIKRVVSVRFNIIYSRQLFCSSCRVCYCGKETEEPPDRHTVRRRKA